MVVPGGTTEGLKRGEVSSCMRWSLVKCRGYPMGFDGLRQSYHGLALLHCSQHDGFMHADAWPQRTLLAVRVMDAWHSPGSDCSGESQGAVLPANVSGCIGALSVPCLH